MKRRAFIAGLGGAAIWSVAAVAQQQTPMRLIGLITGDTESNSESRIRATAFRNGLEELGWVEGRNARRLRDQAEPSADALAHRAPNAPASFLLARDTRIEPGAAPLCLMMSVGRGERWTTRGFSSGPLPFRASQ